jgi:hypothetical protein
MTEIIEARQVSHLIQADFQSTDPDLRLNQPLSVIVRCKHRGPPLSLLSIDF